MEKVEKKTRLAHKTHYSPCDDNGVTEVIVTAIADLTSESHQELPPFHTAINTNSLEDLFNPLDSGGFGAIGKVTFLYYGFVVSVHSTGEVRIFRFEE